MTDQPNEQQVRDAKWNAKAVKLLVGRRIVAVRYMTAEEADDLGYSKRGLLLKLDSGVIVQVLSDDEGNDVGTLLLQGESGMSTLLPTL